MSLCAAVAIATMVLVLVPYYPLTFNALEPIETSACPGEGVATNVDYDLDPTLFDAVDSLSVVSNWIAEDVPSEETGARRLAANSTLPAALLSPGRTSQQSRVLRPAPLQAGTWSLTTTTTARGSLFGVPKSQVVVIESSKELVVLPADDPRCVVKAPREEG